MSEQVNGTKPLTIDEVLGLALGRYANTLAEELKAEGKFEPLQLTVESRIMYIHLESLIEELVSQLNLDANLVKLRFTRNLQAEIEQLSKPRIQVAVANSLIKRRN